MPNTQVGESSAVLGGLLGGFNGKDETEEEEHMGRELTSSYNNNAPLGSMRDLKLEFRYALSTWKVNHPVLRSPQARGRRFLSGGV